MWAAIIVGIIVLGIMVGKVLRNRRLADSERCDGLPDND